MIDLFGRKALICLGYGVAGGAALMFTQGTTETELLATAMLYAFFADIGSLAMTVYTPEVYPVRIRGKGAVIARGWGRFGGMVSPIAAGFLISADNLNLIWGLMAAFQFTSAGLTLLMAHETRGRIWNPSPSRLEAQRMERGRRKAMRWLLTPGFWTHKVCHNQSVAIPANSLRAASISSSEPNAFV